MSKIQTTDNFLFLLIVFILVLSVLVAMIVYKNLTTIKEKFETAVKKHTKIEQLDIDAVLYINLDSRTDRNEEILTELRQINMNMEKVHRVSAVRRKWGALGCSLSHTACLKYIIEKGLKRVLVLEDDAGFESKDIERWNAGVTDINKKLQSDSYDAIFLGGFVRDPEGPLKTDLPTIFQTKNTSCTHAYIVKGEYAPKLLEQTETSIQMLIKDAPNVKQFHLDNAWSPLMNQDRWFISIPTLAYQRESFSDIEMSHANAATPLRGEVVRAWKAGTVL